VFGACGAGFLIRRDLFESIGGFDEDFFMVYEDVDLSYRARLRGARCRYAASAVVRHAGSASIGRVSEQQVFYGQRNLEWTWVKNSPPRLLWRSAASHVVYGMASAVGYARQGRLGVWCRAKLAAVKGLPHVLHKRRLAQRTATVDPERLWQLMDRDWLGIKRREKRFDFAHSRVVNRPTFKLHLAPSTVRSTWRERGSPELGSSCMVTGVHPLAMGRTVFTRCPSISMRTRQGGFESLVSRSGISRARARDVTNQRERDSAMR
jgi:hypothetical protein